VPGDTHHKETGDGLWENDGNQGGGRGSSNPKGMDPHPKVFSSNASHEKLRKGLKGWLIMGLYSVLISGWLLN
jgi:hypothetical protein